MMRKHTSRVIETKTDVLTTSPKLHWCQIQPNVSAHRVSRLELKSRLQLTDSLLGSTGVLIKQSKKQIKNILILGLNLELHCKLLLMFWKEGTPFARLVRDVIALVVFNWIVVASPDFFKRRRRFRGGAL